MDSAAYNPFRLWRTSLLARLVISFLLLSILTVTLVGYVAYIRARVTLTDELFQRLSAIAVLKEAEIERWMNSQTHHVEMLATLPDLGATAARYLDPDRESEAARREAESALRQTFTAFAEKNPDLREIFLLDPDGGRVALSTEPASEGYYAVHDDYFVEGMKGTYAATVYLSPQFLKPTLTVTTPLYGEDGRVVAVVGSHLQLQTLDQLVHGGELFGESGEIFLVDRLNLFVTADRFATAPGGTGAQSFGINEALDGRDGQGRYVNHEGRSVIGVYRWMDGEEIALLAEIDQYSAFAPARALGWTIFGIGTISALLLLVLIFLMARQLIRPLAAMTASATAVAGGDLTRTLPVSTDDEIGILARTLNSMTGRLRQLYEEQRRSEEKFRSLIEGTSDIILTANEHGLIRYVSPSVERVLGYEPSSLLDRPLVDYIHHEDRREGALRFQRAIETGEPASTMRLRCRDVEGHWLHLEVTCNRIHTDNEENIVINARDITGSVEAEQALRQSEERYALAARAANDGLWDWNLVTDELYLSARWKSLLGYAEDEIQDRLDVWFGQVHPEDLQLLKAHIEGHITGRSRYFSHEYRMLHKDGTYRWMMSRGIAVRDEEGRPYRIAGSQTDITDRKHSEQKLVQGAFYDPLTGLPNRKLFMDRLNLLVNRSKQDISRMFAVLFLDLDRFKYINDSLGHLVGDELLVALSRRLESCLRPGDLVARLGGDEFAVLLTNLETLDGATHVAERLQESLSAPFNLNGQLVYVTVSIGIALSSHSYKRPEELLRDADTAMYRAKFSGRARHAIFDAGMHVQAVKLLQLEADLRRAVEKNEFSVYYQPIVSLRTGQITGVEALVRWQHPERGLIRPGEFIPIAEETGLIVPIGEWVLQQACSDNQAWRNAGLPAVTTAVNLSARQFQHSELSALLQGAIERSGLEPNALRLELTESVVMYSPDEAVRILEELKALGVQISIDDFGTGYSSLAYLQQLPLDALKIDQSFIHDLTSNPNDAVIVRAIVMLSHNLNMTVVSEGVETPDQLALLRKWDCDEIQGYLFSHPVPADRIIEMLSSGSELFPEINLLPAT